MKIRPKIQLAFLAVAILPLVISAWVAFTVLRKDLTDRTLDELRAFAEMERERVQKVVDQNLERLALVNSRTRLRLSFSRFRDAPGDELHDEITRILIDVRDSVSGFERISVATPEGIVIVSSDPSHEGMDASGTDYFQKGLERNQAATFVLMEEAPFVRQYLSGPLFLEKEKLGVVIIESRVESMFGSSRRRQYFENSGETLIVMAGPGGEPVILNDADANIGGSPELLLRRAIEGKEGVFTDAVDFRGKKVLAATGFVSDAGLGFVVKVDRVEALAHVTHLRDIALITLGLSMALIAVTALVVARSITRPIRGLADAAEMIAAGDFTRRVDIAGEDEIGALARSFNDMTGRIQDVNRSLEQSVAERTRELEREIKISRRAQEAFAASEERFALAVKGTNDGIWDWDTLTNEVYYAPRFKELLGYDDGEFPNVFESWESRLHPDDREVTLAAVRAHLEFDVPYDVEYRVRCKDGVYRWFQARGMAVKNAEKKPTRMAGSITDITKRKEVERDLKRSNEELEQFAYVASHDLREPLRMIGSYVRLLDERYRGRLDADAEDYIAFASDGAKRMQQLIQDLLEFSRVGSRGKPPQNVSCKEAVQTALENLKVAIEETGATITVEALPRVAGDITQLARLFQNLIENAIKFRGENPPRVHVGVKSDGRFFRFSVSDNGIGIDPRHSDRIFMIFQRLHPQNEYEGTGLGLAVCKKIVERHGGRIWLESKPGEGAKFFFTLPAAS